MGHTKYKKYGYFLDDDILLHGYKDKYGFHPDKYIQCGFSCQIIKKKDINKKFFYSLKRAKDILGCIKIIGNVPVVLAIDAGLAVTKIVYSIDDIRGYYKTSTLANKENEEEIKMVVNECLKNNDITLNTMSQIFSNGFEQIKIM